MNYKKEMQQDMIHMQQDVIDMYAIYDRHAAIKIDMQQYMIDIIAV